jgi:capsular polysaccharide biosynthesis protein
LEDLDFERQLKLFRRAELIVGAHGAGLSFVVFAKSQPLVIELNSVFYGESHRRPWFGMLTLHNGCDYREVVAQDGLSRTDQFAAILREKYGDR